MEKSKQNEYYDLDAIRERLKKAKSHSGMTQTVLSKKIGITQATFSKYLNEGSESFFSVEQLFSLCLYLGLSMDEITGLKEAAEKTKKPCLSDVCEALYGLCKIAPLEWVTVEEDNKKYKACYSKKETVNALFSDASLLSESSDPDLMLNTWKDAFVSKNRDRLKEYSFHTREEYISKCLDNWVNGTSEIVKNWRITKRNLSVSECEKKQFDVLNDYRRIYDEHQIGKYPMQLMYEYIDTYIRENHIPETHDIYYSLSMFKKIYEENN